MVLIETGEDGSVADADDDHDERPATSFLKALCSDIQGARWQRHVVPFTVMVTSVKTISSFTPATQTRHLSAGAVDTLRSPFSHDDLSRLVGHVKEETRPPARLVGVAMAQSLVDSIGNTSTPDQPRHRPDEHLSKDRQDFVEEAISHWHFPAHELNMDELTCAALYMLEHQLRSPGLAHYQLSRQDLMGFLLATRRQYKHEREVHYHNWRHAVDVTQSIYSFLVYIGLCPSADPDGAEQRQRTSVERILTPLDGLILLVSAIGHDVGHPGVNNAFLVACNHPLAQMYNDKSVLENYHCAAYSQLLRRHWPSLSGITGFRSTMISNILATDMQRHFEYMSTMGDLKKRVDEHDGSLDDWSDKDKEHARELVMAILMKAADISNIARPFDISAAWAKILMSEFARQGELEAELQIPTCLFGGPPNKEDILGAAQSQKGFMNLFGFPLFQGISDLMPSVSCSVQTLESNHATWERKIQSEKDRRESEGRHAPLTFSSVGKDEVERAQTEHHRSEPALVPLTSSEAPTTPTKRQPRDTPEGQVEHPAAEERKRLAAGYNLQDEGQRSSMPFLGTQGIPLSPTSASRRSSKDVALDHLHQLSSFALPHFQSESRRGSADMRIDQSFPTSRRGSKDESLTTILVTSQGSPGRRSPSKTAGEAGKATAGTGKRQSIQQNPKTTAARNSVPSSRSHATSSATATTGTQHSPSTQPSSLATTDDEPVPHHVSVSEDPFMMPGHWPTEAGSHRKSAQEGLPSTPPVPPVPGQSGLKPDSSPQVMSRVPSGESGDTGHSSPRRKTEPGGLRESRSRSRLRGLKFWKKKRDVSGVDNGEHLDRE